MSQFTDSANSKSLDQREHNIDASAKRVVVRALDTASGDFVNINADDNGDGTFSLKTTATLSGTVNVASSFSDSSDVDKKALVDADRHAQVDVLSMPAVSIDTTGLATDTNQTTQISELQDIEADIEATNTRLGEVQATPTANTVLSRLKTIADNQLADGHNVTVDNASLAITAAALPLPTGAATAANQQTDALTDTELRATPVVVDLGANNDVTVTTSALPTGASTSANQSTIIGHLDGVETTLTAINNAQLPDGHNVTIDNPGDIGGGTQYSDGDANADPTGTVAMGTDGTNIYAVATDTSGHLQVDVVSAPTTTVTGTVSVNEPVSIDDNGGSITVDASSLPLPTGASTSANQTTIIGHLDGVEGLLTTIDSDTSVLAATDFATEAKQDDIITAIGAIPGGGGTQYDDGDAVATPTGTVALGFDGTNVQAIATDSSGNLQTEVTNTVTVDGSGVTQPVSAASLPLPTGAATSANQTTLIGHVDGIEGLLTTIDADTGNLPTIETNTDYGTVTGGGTETGALRVTVANNSTGVLSVDDNGGSLTVDGTVAATQSGTWDIGTVTSITNDVSIDDGGNSITVDGTVTANLSATDNAVLDSIDEAVSSKQITGINHGVTTVTTAGTDVALAGSTACKRVTIQAQTDNTGVIAVGGSGVDATVATGTGILLFAGDAYELDIDNLADIFIDSSVNGEGVRYVYFT